MKLHTPINKETLKTHFTYSSWKYLLMGVLVLLGMSLAFTTTQYRSPEDKRIDVYIMSSAADTARYDAVLKPIWDSVTPEMETVSSVSLMQIDDYTTIMQLSAYLAASEGDIYFLPETYFKSFAGQGCFVPLEGLLEEGSLQLEGITLDKGYVAVVDEYDQNDNPVYSELHLCGIPMQDFPGMKEKLGVYEKDLYACVTVNNGNDENVIPFFVSLIDTLKTAE